MLALGAMPHVAQAAIQTHAAFGEPAATTGTPIFFGSAVEFSVAASDSPANSRRVRPVRHGRRPKTNPRSATAS